MCLQVVLDALQQRDSRFLERCLSDKRFSGRSRHFIGRKKSELGSKHARLHPTRMDCGWWLSSQTQTQEKWKLILAAAEIAGMKVVRQKMWRSEQKASVKVGF